MRDVITGEAVVVDLPVAQLATRAVAFAIDAAVLGLVLGLVVLVENLTGALAADAAVAAAVVIATIVLVIVGIPVTVETLTRGRSLGKLAMGLRVVRDDGGPISFRHALTRGLAGLMVDFVVLSFFTGAIAVLSSLASPRSKRVGDMLAGTVVVRERAPAGAQAAIEMPPRLLWWARELALSQLPDGLALSARQLLLRAPGLDPRVRESMAASLAADVAAVVSPGPPTGTPAEAYLAAVLAERSRRETERLTAAQPHAPGTSHERSVHPTGLDDSAARAQDGAGPGAPAGVPAPLDPPADGFALPR